MTPLVLRKILNDGHSAALLFCSTDSLEQILSGNLPIEARAEAAAELFLRYYLNPDLDLKHLLENHFHNSEADEFHAFFHAGLFRETHLPDFIWRTDDPFSSACEKKVRERLEELFSEEKTAGFIPVYDPADKGYFLPFHFVPCDSENETPGISDLNGTPIRAWSNAYLDCLPDGFRSHCRVHCYQNILPLPLNGNSFMLPVWLAAERAADPDFPRYDRFRLLATGEIADDRIKPVETKEKAEAVKKSFADAVLLYPENIRFEGDRMYTQDLSCSRPMKRIREDICRIIEARSLIHPDFSYAMRRLQRIEREIRHENCGKWEFILDRLNNLCAAVNPIRSPELHLLGMMLKSASYCHMGNTLEALEWNRKAKEFAHDKGLKKQLLRLEVEELIEFQDLEDFDTIIELKDLLARNIEQTGDNDLRMRYYGTMGQVNAYAGLAGISGFSKEESLKCFEKAVESAFLLESDEEAAQDLNYLHLWHAIFEPGSPDEEKTWRDAGEHIRRQLKNKPDSSKKNNYYLRRQRAFAGYRKLLLSGTFPEPHLFRSSLRLPKNDADSWLFATTLKYIAAVEAAAGDMKTAAADFDDALAAMEKINHPILKFIRMTILAEAWRSLGRDEYRDQALDSLETLREVYPGQSEKWRDFLLGKRGFPGLEYWY